MEEASRKPQNGAAHPAEGTVAPKSESQKQNALIKEGDPNQQRPTHGSDAGVNTANRNGQLPSLNDGAMPKED